MDIDLGQLEIFKRLAVALAAGFLIGLERGWSDRDEPEGQRIAGIRTFGLISLLGALWSLVYLSTGSWAVVLAFLGFCGLVIVAQWQRSQEQGGYGITTTVAALITFVLGAVAVLGHLSIAAGTAVVIAFILGLKPQLHDWLQRLDQEELFATLKLLLISVVILPILPNQGYGPWEALNPYEIWWMVVLVAGISYCGYFASQIAGARRGILLTALSGGLVSSTAVTLTLARLQKAGQKFDSLYATGIILASVTVFPRILIWVAVIRSKLVWGLAAPMILMTLACAVLGVLAWRGMRAKRDQKQPHYVPDNPFELGAALQMGAILAIVMLLAQAFTEWFGDTGVYLLAGVSGVGDVDAITLTLARMANGNLETTVAVVAITIAAIANTVTKCVLAAGVGGPALGRYVIPRFAAVIAVGLIGMAGYLIYTI